MAPLDHVGRCAPVWWFSLVILAWDILVLYTVFPMYVSVKQLRVNGRRRRPRDLDADEGKRGRLKAFVVEGYPVMHFVEWGNQAVATPDLLFPLYQPQLIGLADQRMIMRGWQRDRIAQDDDAATTLQEWSIEILTEMPPITDGMLHGPKPSG